MELRNEKFNLERDIQSKEMRLRLVNMSLEYGLYPTEADMTALQEFFPDVNLRKHYEVEQYHKKLAEILDSQFALEREAVNAEINSLKEQDALREQNKAYLLQKSSQEAKAEADEILRKAIENILREIENKLNTKMKEINDFLFSTPRKPPYIQFRKHNSYKFETPDDTGTGSNFKGMIVYGITSFGA